MRSIAAERSIAVAQVALAWLLARPVVTSVLLGATRMQQLEENLNAVDVVLTPEDIARLDAATAPPPVFPDGTQMDRLTARALAGTLK